MIGKKRICCAFLALIANTKVVLKGAYEIHWPHDSSGKFDGFCHYHLWELVVS